MIYGVDYYPEHRKREKWTYDLENMKNANINCIRLAEFAWKRLEPSEDEYDFSWLIDFINLAKEYDIKIVLCPPVRTIPSYMVKKDPSVLILDEEGNRLAYGSRYTFCLNNPYLRERALKLTKKLVIATKECDNILGFHLDNEYGDEPYCHCDYCKSRWQKWLAEKYETIDNLNEAWGNVFWGLEYDSFDEINTPKKTKVGFSPSHLGMFSQFRSYVTCQFVKEQSEAIKAISDKFISTNNQPLWNPKTDYYEMAKYLDICGTNYYPPYESYRKIELGLCHARSYKKSPFYVYELKNGPHMKAGDFEYKKGDLQKLVMHCIANGADGTFFFRYRACPFGYEQNHGSLTSYDGQPLDIYDEAKVLGERIKNIGDIIEKTVIKSEIAIMYDFKCRWYFESGNGWMPKKELDLYMGMQKMVYRVLRNKYKQVDACSSEDDLSKYKCVVLPMQVMVNSKLGRKLKEYVENGGILVMTPLTGLIDEEYNINPSRVSSEIASMLNMDMLNFNALSQDRRLAFKYMDNTYYANLFLDLPKVNDDVEKEGYFTEDEYLEYSPVYIRNIDKGKVVYISCFPNTSFYSDLFTNLFEEKEEFYEMNTSSIEVSCRENDDTKFYFFINGANEEKIIYFNEECNDIYKNKKIKKGKYVMEPKDVIIIEKKKSV